MTKDKNKALAQETIKLIDYITNYYSRQLNVENALGKPGVNRLLKMQKLAESILED